MADKTQLQIFYGWFLKLGKGPVCIHSANIVP